MKHAVIFALLFLVACNSIKETTTSKDQLNDNVSNQDSSGVVDNVFDSSSVKHNSGTWERIVMYPRSYNNAGTIDKSINNAGGITVIERGTYNRDKSVKVHKQNHAEFNVFHHFNVTTRYTVIETKKSTSRVAWLPMLLLAIGGVAAFLATRYPWFVSLFIGIVNTVISKFKNNKKQQNR